MEGKLEGRRGEGRVMRSLEARMRRPSFGINRPVVSVEAGPQEMLDPDPEQGLD